MKTLLVLSAYLSMALAGYPKVQTWPWWSIQLRSSRGPPDNASPDLLPCLDIAIKLVTDQFDALVEAYPEFSRKESSETHWKEYDTNVEEHESMWLKNSPEDMKISVIPPFTFGALIPAPSGLNKWTVREMATLVEVIGESYFLPIKDRSFFWRTENLILLMWDMELPSPSQFSPEDRFTREIIAGIIRIVLHIKRHMDKYDVNKDTFPVYTPAADISVWTLPELNEAITQLDSGSELLSYLKKARENELQLSKDETEYCVVTPVGLIPQDNPYHYVPEEFKNLTKMVKILVQE